jgi:hypothetical protein
VAAFAWFMTGLRAGWSFARESREEPVGALARAA